MTTEEKHNALKKIFWDSSLSGLELHSILKEEKYSEFISRDKIFVRMLERLGWA